MRDEAGNVICPRCRGPRGTNKDGSPRKHRYCGTCQAIAARESRDRKKRELAALKERVRQIVDCDEYAKKAVAALLEATTAPIERGV